MSEVVAERGEGQVVEVDDGDTVVGEQKLRMLASLYSAAGSPVTGSGIVSSAARRGVTKSLTIQAVTRGERLIQPSEVEVSEAVSVLEELARDQHARPVTDLEELRPDVWSSDEELEEFLESLPY